MARGPTAEGVGSTVRSLGFILNTRRCHWRVLSFEEGHLGRRTFRKHHRVWFICVLEEDVPLVGTSCLWNDGEAGSVYAVRLSCPLSEESP